MKCAEMRRLVAEWEKGSILDEADLHDAMAHGAKCGACGAAFRTFLLLGCRDAGLPVRPEPSDAAHALADSVMVQLVPAGRRGRCKAPPKLVRYAAAAIAAAACAIAAVGVVVWKTDTASVRFVLDAPEARTVFLAGSFSAWDSSGLELRKTGAGRWERTVRLRRGQAYSYNFIIDGTVWVVDPAATERIDDGFGGQSALIRL